MANIQWNKVGIQENVPVEVKEFGTDKVLWSFSSLKDCATFFAAQSTESKAYS